MRAYIRYLISICVVLLLLSASPAAGQDRQGQTVRMGRLDIRDGLSQGMVYCMFQDSHGFMWFGTKEGLNRYDGRNFLVYRKIPGDSSSLPDNYVYAITEDTRGRLWIATRGGGLAMFEPDVERFTSIPLLSQEDMPVRCVNDVEMDGQGRLWVTVQRSQLIVLDTRLERTEDIRASARMDGPMRWQDNQEVNRLRKDVFGRLTYLAEDGVFRLDEERDRWDLIVDWARLLGDVPLAHAFNSVAVGSDSLIWVSARVDGSSLIFCMSQDGSTELKRMQLRVGSDMELIRDMIEGTDGRLYLVSFNYLLRYDTRRDSYTAVEARPELENTYSGWGNHLFMSRGGILWIGSSGYGINTFDHLTLAFHARTGNLNEALFGKELRAFERFLLDRSGGAEKLVNVIFPIRTNDGSVWCGSLDHGLLHYDATSGRVRRFGIQAGDPYSFLLMRLQRPFVDSRGFVWVGNGHGISRLDPMQETWAHFWFSALGPDLTATDDQITAFYEAGDGTLWLGSSLRGLAHFDPADGSFTHFRYSSSDPGSISQDNVISIAEDPVRGGSVLWIGTDGGGLNRMEMETKRFRRFSRAEGLPNDVVYGILPDAAGRLWLSTNAGLCRLDPQREIFRQYDERDGLQSNEFNRMEYHAVGRKLCFGGVNGYNLFDPAEIQDNATVPAIALTTLRLFNEAMVPGEEDSPLQCALPYTRQIELSHDQNMVTIEFAALDYHAPDRNRFRYKLEGFNEKWIDAGTDRSATFTNLDPGEYVFHVVGSNNHGVWNEVGSTLHITIRPPWWKTVWAYGLYGFVVLFALIAVDRVQRRRVINRERANSTVREAKLRAEAAELEARAVRAEHARKNRDMQLASTIQQRVLPQRLPKVKGYDLAAISLPAEEIGGDYYDCIILPDGKLVMVVADVTGKGVPASLLVNSLHASLRAYLDQESDTQALVRRLNRFLYESTPPSAFITFMIAVLDPESGEVELVNAGHNPAMLHLNGSVTETQRSRLLPLGCTLQPMEGLRERFTLEPGQALLLYTDGITEAMNVKREPFGEERLEQLLLGHNSWQSAVLLGYVVSELQLYASGAAQSDDITAVFIRRKPEEEIADQG